MNEETTKLVELMTKVSQNNEICKTFNFCWVTEGELKEYTAKIDFKKVDPNIAEHMGFCLWDDDSTKKHLRLVPLWLFNYLPDDMEMVCIDGNIEKKKDVDNNIRYGCVAYMIEVGSEYTDESKN